MPKRTKPNPFADLTGDLRRAVAADPVPHAFDCLCRDCIRAAERRLGMPSYDELRDVLGMLQQADSDLTGLRPETAQQTLRDAMRVLTAALGSNATTPQQRYAERVAAQTARIDAALNEEGRKQRSKRKR